MKVSAIAVTFFLLSISHGIVYGQHASVSTNFRMGLPTRAFQQKVETLYFPELSVNALYHIPDLPIQVGGEMAYGRYGTALTKSREVLNGTEQQFRIRRNNNTVSLLGIIRVMPELQSPVRPFVEAQLGAIHAYTRSSVRENRFSEPMASGTELYDWALVRQVGGGVLFAVDKNKETFIELRMSYLRTGSMQFLTKAGATYDEEGQVALSPQKAPFSLLQPGIGVRHIFR
jgi:hypothetical protein